MDCVDCMFYGLFYCRLYERFSLFDTNVLTGFMISLFLAAPAPRVRRARKLMGTSLQHGLRFGKSTFLYGSKVFLLITFPETFFHRQE